MSTLHRQFPQYAFDATRKAALAQQPVTARESARPAPQPQQQARQPEGEPTAVPGYN